MAAKIKKIGVTNDKISGRGGLALILRYVEKTRLYDLISWAIMPKIPISSKGLQLQQFLNRLAYFFDGTDMTMAGFEAKKTDHGYASVLENKLDQMASSHQMKRFFAKLSILPNAVFRKILHELFIWRLKIEKPKIVFLGIDTMVLDNDVYFAVKITSRARYIFLNVTKPVFQTIKIDQLWERCQSPPKIQFA